ncbi:MAG: hypothetical protein K9N49_08750 [Candidatus Marinimicrobia bacterium]|nr:hypothetical protein [Candidatus Neomarinimicrobiota bacterium]
MDRKSEDAYADLKAHALVFEASGRRAAVVCADIIAFGGAWTDSIRKRLDERGVVPAANLLLNASHTHCGPVVENTVYGPYPQYHNPGYAEWLADEIVNLVQRATEAMFECELFHADAPCNVGISRRRLKPDGSLQFGPAVSAPYDPWVRTLRIVDRDGTVRALLFGYGCHPAAMKGYSLGPDWVGYAREAIEDTIPDCTALYMQGFEGDQRPRNLDGQGNFAEGTVTDLKNLGWQMAQSVLATLTGTARAVSGETVAGRLAEIRLPLDAPPSRAELDARATEGDEFDRTWASRMLKIVDRKGSLPTSLAMPIQAIRIGNLILLGLAGEICIPYDGILRQLIGDRPAILAGCSNDCVAYIPTDAMLPRGGYEVSGNHTVFFYPAPFTAGVEGAIVEGFAALLRATDDRVLSDLTQRKAAEGDRP